MAWAIDPELAEMVMMLPRNDLADVAAGFGYEGFEPAASISFEPVADGLLSDARSAASWDCIVTLRFLVEQALNRPSVTSGCVQKI